MVLGVVLGSGLWVVAPGVVKTLAQERWVFGGLVSLARVCLLLLFGGSGGS